MVSDIIKTVGTKQFWDCAIAQQLLNEEDFQLMCTLYLPQHGITDRLVWIYSTTGNYTIKSGYKMEMMDFGRAFPNVLPPHGSLCTLPILPKLNLFLWRLLSLAIGANTRLQTRGISVDPQCRRSSNDQESVNHLFFTCPISVHTWRSNQVTLGFSSVFMDELESNMRFIFNLQSLSHLSLEQKLTHFLMLWKIWKSRNNFIFNGARITHEQDADYVTSEVCDWIKKS